MAYKIFEQNNVKYKLFLENHLISNQSLINNAGGIKDLDILVLEAGLDLKTTMNLIHNGDLHKELFADIPRENPDIAIYAPNFPISFIGMVSSAAEISLALGAVYYGKTAFKKESLSRRKLLGKLGKIGVGFLGSSLLGSFINAAYLKGDIELISETNAIRTGILPTSHSGFRNASLSKVLEEYIIPNEIKDKVSLNVGIIFGAAHSGIEHCIKYRWLRDTTIDLYKNFGYPGITRDDLNKIKEIKYEDGAYVGKELSIDLF